MEGAGSSAPTRGTLVDGRYRIGEMLGEGGFGVVLSARDEVHGQDVALKILQLVSEESAERFWREARLASQLDSDHVVRVFDTGVWQEQPYLVMERLRGQDFSEKVRHKPLPLPVVMDCLLQTCEALAHAHGAGIVHRDIKASNLFEHATSSGKRLVKVLDFGVSRIVPGRNQLERSLTRTAHAGTLGSPPYMSPEHIRDPRSVDARTDIWALGVVAYLLLARKYPFDGSSTPELFIAILERRPPKLSELRAGLPPEIDRIFSRCLAYSRDDRFPDVGALAQALAPFASSELHHYGARVAEIARRMPARIAESASPKDSGAAGQRAGVKPKTVTVEAPGSEDDVGTAIRAPFAAPRTELMAGAPPIPAAGSGPVLPPVLFSAPMVGDDGVDPSMLETVATVPLEEPRRSAPPGTRNEPSNYDGIELEPRASGPRGGTGRHAARGGSRRSVALLGLGGFALGIAIFTGIKMTSSTPSTGTSTAPPALTPVPVLPAVPPPPPAVPPAPPVVTTPVTTAPSPPAPAPPDPRAASPLVPSGQGPVAPRSSPRRHGHRNHPATSPATVELSPPPAAAAPPPPPTSTPDDPKLLPNPYKH